MKQTLRTVAAVALIAFSTTSCTMMSHSMKSPNNHVEFVKADFTFSEQVNANASSTKIFGIDFARLFNRTGGTVVSEGAALPIPSLTSIPVIGTTLMDQTSSYALYELMSKNPGYDVVFYPQYEKIVNCPIGIPLITKTTVKVTARLAKMK